MKKINSILMPCLLTAGLAIVTACTGSEEEPVLQAIEDNVLKIETCIADTRDVVTATEFSKGDQIGIFAYTTDGHDYTGNSSNVCATYSGSDWSLNPNIVMSSRYDADVYAYYPYNANATFANDSINIDITPTAENGQPDYMVGSCTGVSASQPTAKLTFNHALARITLAITKGATDVGEGIISKVRIENGYRNLVFQAGIGSTPAPIKSTLISTKGKMSLKDGGIAKTLNQEDYIEIAANVAINEKESERFDFLLMPIKAFPIKPADFERVSIIITIDGEDYKISLDDPNWLAGQQYTYPITINRKEKATEAKVGDYYYSDGTWSTEYDTSKDCIGIVFALSDKEYGDINPSLASSNHGRIVALNDYATTATNYAWGTQGVVYNEQLCFDGFIGSDKGADYCYLPMDGKNEYNKPEGYCIPYNYESWIELPSDADSKLYSLCDYNGYEWTKMVSSDDSSSIISLKEMNNKVWYVPSVGEMARLGMAYGYYDKFSDKNGFTGFGDNTYWTSCLKYSTQWGSAAWAYLPFTGCFWAYTVAERMKVRLIASF